MKVNRFRSLAVILEGEDRVSGEAASIAAASVLKQLRFGDLSTGGGGSFAARASGGIFGACRRAKNRGAGGG